MASRRRGYAQLSNGFYSDTKIRKALKVNPRAGLVFVMAISFASSNLTDGYISPDDAEFVLDAHPDDLEWLVDEGMLEETDGGWAIHNYLKYNVSRERVLAEMDSDNRRKRNAKTSTNPNPNTFRPESDRNPTGIQSDVNQEPRTKNINPPLTPPKEGDDESFPEAWEAYPRHSGSIRRACDAYHALIDQGVTDHATIMASIGTLSENIRKGVTERRMVPGMAKWLETGQWRDTIPETRPNLPDDAWVCEHLTRRLQPPPPDMPLRLRRFQSLIRDGTDWQTAADTIIHEYEKETS